MTPGYPEDNRHRGFPPPQTAVDVDNSWERPRADWSVHARQPGRVALALVFDVFDVYFKFDVRGHLRSLHLRKRNARTRRSGAVRCGRRC